jgi:uncharacterized membrane protein YccC
MGRQLRRPFLEMLVSMLAYLRILVATVCLALFVYGFAEYVDYPKGATATLKGLMGFVALGLAPWIAPLNFASRILRNVGTIISVVALALFLLLYGALQNGL